MNIEPPSCIMIFKHGYFDAWYGTSLQSQFSRRQCANLAVKATRYLAIILSWPIYKEEYLLGLDA